MKVYRHDVMAYYNARGTLVVGRAHRFHLPNDGGRAIWTYEYDETCPMQRFISRRVCR